MWILKYILNKIEIPLFYTLDNYIANHHMYPYNKVTHGGFQQATLVTRMVTMGTCIWYSDAFNQILWNIILMPTIVSLTCLNFWNTTFMLSSYEFILKLAKDWKSFFIFRYISYNGPALIIYRPATKTSSVAIIKIDIALW